MDNSALFDETTFYQSFIRDLDNCKNEVIIENPFITSERMKMFIPIFKKLIEKKVKIYIFIRDPKEHSEGMEMQSETAIRTCEVMGIQVLICT